MRPLNKDSIMLWVDWRAPAAPEDMTSKDLKSSSEENNSAIAATNVYDYCPYKSTSRESNSGVGTSSGSSQGSLSPAAMR